MEKTHLDDMRFFVVCIENVFFVCFLYVFFVFFHVIIQKRYKKHTKIIQKTEKQKPQRKSKT